MWGIIAITQNGLLLAKALKSHFPKSVIYTLPKWCDNDTVGIDGELVTFTGQLMALHRTLVFVMATGIVVRCVAKHLVDKTTDAAVVVLDEKGQFAISLLSGHLGGANAVAAQIAEKIHAVPVITTASDVQGVPSVDMIAKAHNLIVESMADAKHITAMAVNGQQIAFSNRTLLPLPTYFANNNAEAKALGLVIVSHQLVITENRPYARLIPRNIIIGIGCKRGVPGKNIIAFINEVFERCNIHPRSIRQLASIDIKADEPGIHETADYFGTRAVFIDKADIEEIEGQFASSPFVKAHVGVSGVCEPAAFIAGGKQGRFISQKQSKEGMTLAIFESAVLKDENS
jgi:cobalt-precorrin 5A hydrolase